MPGEAIRAALDELPWLDHAFGRAEILVRNPDRPRAAHYAVPDPDSDTEYIDLAPDASLINYAFLIADERRGVDGIQRRARVSIICVFDHRKLANHGITSAGGVAHALADKLQHNGRAQVRYPVTASFEPRAVFSPVSIKTVPLVLLRRPYGCCRVDADISWLPNCP